ncbi:hypothetical protein [Streptomyces shaanxiensis]|uniref:hypothetical protein n=1 Tax=Streptomyces shaanxiensis TaxID=653357 RepID=UPI0031E97494
MKVTEHEQEVFPVVLVSVLCVYDVSEALLAAPIHVLLLGFSSAANDSDEALFGCLPAAHGHRVGYVLERDPSPPRLAQRLLL